MPALQPQLQLITLEQYDKYPDQKRIEVFDGIIYDMASPSQEHQTILTELLVIIRNYIKSKNGNCSVFPAPFDVKLSDTVKQNVENLILPIFSPYCWVYHRIRLKYSLPKSSF